MRLLITGAAGLLGRALTRRAGQGGHDVSALDRGALDVTDSAAVRDTIDSIRPDWVAHLAAYTRVDAAETDRARAMAVNRDGTALVAAAAVGVSARLLYISTDFVFDGSARTPYPPDAPVRPLGVYGATKLAGERAARDAGGRTLIARTGWLYGVGGRNFVDAVLERTERGEALRVVSDQRGGPTWSGSLANALVGLMEADADGVFHVADRGDASWFELAEAAAELAGITARIEPVTSAEYGAPAPRPPYSVLEVSATEQRLGTSLPHWKHSLARYLAERSEHRMTPDPSADVTS